MFCKISILLFLVDNDLTSGTLSFSSVPNTQVGAPQVEQRRLTADRLPFPNTVAELQPIPERF